MKRLLILSLLLFVICGCEDDAKHHKVFSSDSTSASVDTNSSAGTSTSTETVTETTSTITKEDIRNLGIVQRYEVFPRHNTNSYMGGGEFNITVIYTDRCVFTVEGLVFVRIGFPVSVKWDDVISCDDGTTKVRQ